MIHDCQNGNRVGKESIDDDATGYHRRCPLIPALVVEVCQLSFTCVHCPHHWSLNKTPMLVDLDFKGYGLFEVEVKHYVLNHLLEQANVGEAGLADNTVRHVLDVVLVAPSGLEFPREATHPS